MLDSDFGGWDWIRVRLRVVVRSQVQNLGAGVRFRVRFIVKVRSQVHPPNIYNLWWTALNLFEFALCTDGAPIRGEPTFGAPVHNP